MSLADSAKDSARTEALGRLDELPPARPGHAPTPIDARPNLGARTGSARLYVKRAVNLVARADEYLGHEAEHRLFVFDHQYTGHRVSWRGHGSFGSRVALLQRSQKVGHRAVNGPGRRLGGSVGHQRHLPAQVCERLSLD